MLTPIRATSESTFGLGFFSWLFDRRCQGPLWETKCWCCCYSRWPDVSFAAPRQVHRQAFQSQTPNAVWNMDGKWPVHVYPIWKEESAEQRTGVDLHRSRLERNSSRFNWEVVQILWNRECARRLKRRCSLGRREWRDRKGYRGDYWQWIWDRQWRRRRRIKRTCSSIYRTVIFRTTKSSKVNNQYSQPSIYLSCFIPG